MAATVFFPLFTVSPSYKKSPFFARAYLKALRLLKVRSPRKLIMMAAVFSLPAAKLKGMKRAWRHKTDRKKQNDLKAMEKAEPLFIQTLRPYLTVTLVTLADPVMISNKTPARSSSLRPGASMDWN